MHPVQKLAQKVSLAFRSRHQDFSYANITIQAITGLIDITDTCIQKFWLIHTIVSLSKKKKTLVPISDSLGKYAEDQDVNQQVYLLISTSVWTKIWQQ